MSALHAMRIGMKAYLQGNFGSLCANCTRTRPIQSRSINMALRYIDRAGHLCVWSMHWNSESRDSSDPTISE